ncbi:MAG: DNA polymerase III subunit delta [Terrisporobacter sp.]|uniref:hypothetical protein n=1 Tax=Terrisporobacter sp. TaxID=1965305 RepID=UPI002FC61FEE
MKNKSLFKRPVDPDDGEGCIKLSEKINLFKDTKWISFGTYIMTVENFAYGKGVKEHSPILNTFYYQSESYIVNASYNGENYSIEERELYENVSKGDKIVVTIKYSYDKEDKLIHSNIHSCHPYPITNN